MPVPQKYTGFKYDPKSRRYRAPDGSITPLRQIKAILALKANEPQDDAGYGQRVNFNRHPESDVWSAVERIVGQGEGNDVGVLKDPDLQRAAKNFNHILAFVEQDDMKEAKPYPVMVRDEAGKNWVQADASAWQQPPQPIPTGIRSAMNLAEYYCNTQGDVFQFIESPIDLCISELVISVPKDRAVGRLLRDLYDPENLNMRYHLYQNMLISSIFGSAYPMEVPDSPDNASVIKQIVPLPPKFMWVGYNIVSGLMGYNNPSPYAIRPMDGSANWTQELARQMFMPETYNAYGSGFNEQVAQGWGLPVNPQYLHPVRAKALHWNRYPLPPISRAFRSISTRAIYQEMRRGMLEGYKNQLWVFLLGTKEMPPSPQEMLALRNAVDGISATRTGNLVWRYGLDVQVKAPNALNDAIGNEVSQAFTLEIMRDLGANARLYTGNKVSVAGSGAGDSGVDIDLSVWLRRLEFIRTNIMEWEYLFRLRQADRWDERKPGDPPGKARLALENTKAVKFSESLLEIAARVKQEIVPIYQVGLSSPQSALSKADMDYETELQNKKDNQKNSELFMPPPTYNQLATPASGEPTQSATTAPKGRPVTTVNPTKLKAAWDDSPTRRLYYAAILAALDEFWNTQDVEAFIDDLKALNVHWLDAAGAEAYREAGGVGIPDLESLRIASNYVNSYADNFGDDLSGMLKADEPVGTEKVRRRTMQYPQEGLKAAIVNLTNQAMAERGASHWRRVLHPELSKNGPCPDCVADSSIVHEMTEPFAVMHPGDVCGTQELGIRYFTNGIPSVEVPTPNYGNDLAREIFGDQKQGRTRRKRL